MREQGVNLPLVLLVGVQAHQEKRHAGLREAENGRAGMAACLFNGICRFGVFELQRYLARLALRVDEP